MNELDSEESTVPKDLVGPYFSASPLEGDSTHSSPTEACSPPSYADITRKKHGASFGSSDYDSSEQLSKKGRNSKKELREEEGERLKNQGS